MRGARGGWERGDEAWGGECGEIWRGWKAVAEYDGLSTGDMVKEKRKCASDGLSSSEEEDEDEADESGSRLTGLM